ncbi:uncharacterized protein LOC114351878 [Ostrinia furnacalis]|uniref:uncharacterized protein LOC114351878 n=1 Tax=Ostrinia furnacalis TaxID=93504 RepID=UPI00103D32C3|nr:uncharacterized protein LOC114351878 [Ostrinia furnacalis]
MYRYVAVILLICDYVRGPPPVRLTIDCGSEEKDSLLDGFRPFKQRSASGNLDINSFCNMIQRAIPKAIKDGRFVPVDEDDDQDGLGNALTPISVAPPNGFIPNFPKLKTPRLKIPRINVPTLGVPERTFSAPRVGSPMSFSKYREPEEETSAEKMEKFKKGVQKMLHVVKVLGKIDHYLSERTRIIIEKLSKTFAE